MGSTLEEAVHLATLLKGQVEQANASTAQEAPWAVRASLATSYRAALQQVSRLRGEGQLSESTLAKSAVFRRYLERILEALRPHPDALRSVRDAVADLEATQ